MSQTSPAALQPRPQPSAAAAARPRRPDDAAVRSLAAAIHAELRESLGPDDLVRLATALLDHVAEDVRARRPRPSEGPAASAD